MLQRKRKPEALTTADIRRALYRYCGFQERSPGDVRRKLHELGVAAEHHPAWMEELREQQFVDEERYARLFVRGKFGGARGWGRIKLRYALREDAIPDSVIEIALAEEIDEADYTATLDKLLAAKNRILAPDIPHRAQRLAQYLAQKGYEHGEIAAALKRIDAETDFL